MFEAIHGSAPDLAGKDLANPSGLIQAAILMLNHLGYFKVAERIQNAWLKTLESGIHTADIYRPDLSTRKVGTQEFTEAVCRNLGELPEQFKKADYADFKPVEIPAYRRSKPATKTLEGVDIFVDWRGSDPKDLAFKLQALENESLRLSMITNRGVMVWPKGLEETFKTDHWRCRYSAVNGSLVRPHDIINVLRKAALTGVDVIKTENLYRFGEKRGYSLGQGQ